jgi:hypothetical protein
MGCENDLHHKPYSCTLFNSFRLGLQHPKLCALCRACLAIACVMRPMLLIQPQEKLHQHDA